jgi:hypothetical protein
MQIPENMIKTFEAKKDFIVEHMGETFYQDAIESKLSKQDLVKLFGLLAGAPVESSKKTKSK